MITQQLGTTPLDLVPITLDSNIGAKPPSLRNSQGNPAPVPARGNPEIKPPKILYEEYHLMPVGKLPSHSPCLRPAQIPPSQTHCRLSKNY